jgi:cold shock CspA family protein
MGKRVSKLQIGKTMTGRIMTFDRMKGYGFIRTPTSEDIFLSSYDVSRNVWKKISVGDYVEFVVGENVDASKPVVAKNTTIIKKMPRCLSIKMPNNEELEVRYINQFGKKTLIEDGYRELYPDYPNKSFRYLYIKIPGKSFVFNQYGSPVIIDGETDVDEFYNFLTDLLIRYDIDRDYESF